ncbi:Uncharacterised protein [uncultured archaeon]|nr:Uncharacterised protein [uncultured archaeon]
MKKIWIYMLFAAILTVSVDVATLINSTTTVTSSIWSDDVLSTPFLDNHSESVVVGHVIEILPSQWNTPDRKKPKSSEAGLASQDASIYTDVIIKVDKNVKGSTPATLVVRTLGGQVGDNSNFVEDEAKFELGENVLLFLTKEDPFTDNSAGTHYRITGWKHGKFSITKDNQAVRPSVPAEYQKIPLGELLNSIGAQ